MPRTDGRQFQNNISSVAFKIYEPVVSHSSTYTFAASDVEHTLRTGGHLVYADSLRRGIWCFYLTAKDGSSIGASGVPVLGATLDLCGYKLGLIEEGRFEPISLLKYRGPGANPINTPSSSSSSGSALENNPLRSATSAGVPSTLSSTSNAPEGDTKAGVTMSMDTKGYGTIQAKDVHEYFISAVLASLSSKFCESTLAIPLNSRSFILTSRTPPASDHDNSQGATIANLRVYLTTSGSLVISISLVLAEGLLVSPTSLNPVLPPPGATICAAPLGVFGTIQGMTDADQFSMDGSVVQSPETQVTRFRPDIDAKAAHWRSICSKMLEMRGMSPVILSKSSWLTVQFLRRKPNESRTEGKHTPAINPLASILWPAVLCYRKRTTSPLSGNGTVDYGIATLKDGFDSMNNAKTWFLSNGEREEFLARRKKERESATTKNAGEADSRTQQHNGYSPLAIRRTSNPGAAVGTMYPTPPDGIQNPVGATPSLDGTTSSPGNQAPTSALVDIDATMATSGGLGDSFADGWDGSDSKREQPFIQAENLFGDLGDDVFADNDITDADFSFFDEQPGGMDLGLPDLPDLGAPNSNPMDMHMSHMPLDLTPQKPMDSTKLKPNTVPAPPVFAKPELKHARSTLADENRQRELAKTRSTGGIKRQPSPFDPNTVYKRLKASLHGGVPVLSNTTNRSGRRGSVFEKVDLDPALSLINRKYQVSGRFDCHLDPEKENKKTHGPTEPPTTGYLQRHGQRRPTLKDLPLVHLSDHMARITGALENSSIHQQSPSKFEDTTSDADEASLVSDQDDASDFSDEPSSPTKSSTRRRLGEDDRESLAPSFREPDNVDDSPSYSSVDLSKFSNTDAQEIPIAKYFAISEPFSQQTTYAEDEVFMTVAQILTDQAVSGSLKYGVSNPTPSSLAISGLRRELSQNIRNSMQTLQAILPPCLQGATECQFRPFVEVQDVPLLGPPNWMQPRPPGGPEQRPSMFQIPAPHLELRRYESRLSVLPSAAGFWESLGLGPCYGPKDIHSVCVFPNLEGMADNAGMFLDRLESVYESLKLGSFERMASAASIQNGLVPLEVDDPLASTWSRQGENMAKLAHAISLSSATSKNFVIYFVYMPDNPNTIVESCAAFQSFFDMYKKGLKRTAQNELVLQLVPINALATSTSLVVLLPSEYMQLCLETYDRCALFDGPMPAPAVVLEQPLARGIEFQLGSTPSANVLHENSCMHIAYAQSTDDRWITAAWTDNRGSKQMTASYCRGRKGRPILTPITDVVNDIWETTRDLISMWKVHWRVIVTKCGPMDQQEIDVWGSLGQTETRTSISLTLLTVDTNPSLQLIPPAVKIPVTAPSVFYTTPVSTPQSSMMSPDQAGNPPTPMGAPTTMGVTTPGADNSATEADADATLVDVTDTTWGAIVSHRLNNSSSLVDLNPAIVSGYLVKRGGARIEDAPVVMEVNIVHSEGNPRLQDLILREMLTHFRGLGTIARTRSMVDKDTDVRPWHVAAAEKGVQALYQLM